MRDMATETIGGRRDVCKILLRVHPKESWSRTFNKLHMSSMTSFIGCCAFAYATRRVAVAFGPAAAAAVSSLSG